MDKRLRMELETMADKDKVERLTMEVYDLEKRLSSARWSNKSLQTHYGYAMAEKDRTIEVYEEAMMNYKDYLL